MKTIPTNKELNAVLINFQKKNFDKAKELALLLTKNYPSHPFGWKVMGVLLKKNGQFLDALNFSKKAFNITPQDAEISNNIGLIYNDLNKFKEAQIYFQKSININQKLTEAYFNLGVVLEKQDKLDESEKIYYRLIDIKNDHIAAFNNLGNVLKKNGKLNASIECFKKAININPKFFESYYNLGVIYLEEKNLLEAKKNFEKAISLNSRFDKAYNNLGVTYYELNLLVDAETTFKKVLEFKPNFPEVYDNLGNLYSDMNKLDKSIQSYEKALSLKSNFDSVKSKLFHQKQKICDFRNYEQNLKDVILLGIEGDQVSPFPALSWIDDPENQLKRSKNYSNKTFKRVSKKKVFNNRNEKIKLAYFSSDFHEFPGMYLMIGMLENHNTNDFEIYIFSYGPDKNDKMRNRIKQSADYFIDIKNLSNQEVIQIVRDKKIDISIHRNGYTKNSRTEIFQYRISPIQINFLGYPGTLGTDFMDYMIADKVVIPEEQRDFYSEKIIYLPNTYQPNDDKRQIKNLYNSKKDLDLPEKCFVLCSFNNSYKISPIEFTIWMRILKKNKNTVLWLLESNRWAENNLRNSAKSFEVDPTRIIFAKKIPHEEHLGRLKHADLFIDTFNYNAHTTASDALWSGLPIVTKQGKQFAARVASSLLNSIGLSELITQTQEEYEVLINKLIDQPLILEKIRNKLLNNRFYKPLFDTKRYTQNFESGLKEAYNNYVNGNNPKDIIVSENKKII